MASEYLKWKYRDVKPDEKIEYTKQEKLRNWWQYHKWWLLAGVLVLAAGADILVHMLGLGQVKPDYQVAYVASIPPGDEAAAALEAAMASLGEDCNGDGRITVQVHVYADMSVSPDPDAAHYAAAAQVRLMADMESCESYFFLCENPEAFQENYQILAREDGAPLPLFRAGQYLSLKLPIGESFVSRPYSISAGPRWALEGMYAVTVKRNPGGFAADWMLDNLKPGDRITATSPFWL